MWHFRNKGTPFRFPVGNGDKRAVGILWELPASEGWAFVDRSFSETIAGAHRVWPRGALVTCTDRIA